MADPWVMNVQQWLNDTYTGVSGWNQVDVDGVTGWATMHALTRALQHELGITTLSDNFGTGTLSALAAIGDIGPTTTGAHIANIINIIIGGTYCKGYNGGGGTLPGQWLEQTTVGITALQENIGLAQTGTVSPKLFKALLNMDAYVRVGAGNDAVRVVQQWMNATYLDRSWFYIIPADGSYSRDVQTALVYAIQEELHVAGANGNYGPGTRSAVAAAPVITVGSAADGPGQHWVHLFQAALRFNTYDADFTGTFTYVDSAFVSQFQTFCQLPVTGGSNYQTWSSLLVSNGDPDRVGQAVDCVTQITAARATTLVSNGRQVVGRYLTNAPGTGSLNKKIQPGELSAIFGANLRVFPIYQTTGNAMGYFTDAQGYSDASAAVAAAAGYGFRRDTVIYFGVDFDSTDDQITSNIIPYFEGVQRAIHRLADRFKVGVYGTRNVCGRVSAQGLASRSFVSGISYGYSGNLGFLLPGNWAFDQISTVTLGTGTGSVQVDNDIYSGRDAGQSSVASLPSGQTLDVEFDMSQATQLGVDMDAYCDTVTSPTVGLAHGNPVDVVPVVLQHDALITNLSRAWGIRKALIQAVAFWEYWKTTYEDILVADPLVQAWYAYMQAYEAWQAFPIGEPPVAPIPPTDDSSTGFAQIFARTAITAHNWAVDAGQIDGETWDIDDWHVVWDVWQDLHGDADYNLAAVPQVLMWGAIAEKNLGGPRLDYTYAEVTEILARYNGTGDAAADYGVEVHGVYDVFESYNASLRA